MYYWYKLTLHVCQQAKTRDAPVSARVAVRGGPSPFCNTFYVTSRYDHIVLTFNSRSCVIASNRVIRPYWMQSVRATTKPTPWLNSTVRACGHPCSLCKNRVRGVHRVGNMEMCKQPACHIELCVRKADESSIKYGVENKFESIQFIPRWFKGVKHHILTVRLVVHQG